MGKGLFLKHQGISSNFFETFRASFGEWNQIVFSFYKYENQSLVFYEDDLFLLNGTVMREC